MEEKHHLEKHKEEGTEKYYLPISILIAALILATPIFLVGNDISGKLAMISKSVEKIKVQEQKDDTTEEQEVKISLEAFKDDDAMKGKEDAKVTIIEFSDFQCPFCEIFYNNTYKQIVKDYIQSGKANIIYRDFPLNSRHPQAQKAAEAAECAGDFGLFWEMHDKLFENQRVLSVENYKKWAQEIGIDQKKFSECLDSGKYAQEVNKDSQDALKIGFGGTPSFLIIMQNTEKVRQALSDYKTKNPQYANYINEVEDKENQKVFGVLVVGALPYEVFKGIIEAGQA